MALNATIEFNTNPYYSDFEDLTQECTAYMKTKLFMAKRILQQQEEIEMLKQSVLYHSGKHIQLYDILKNLQEQIDSIKKDNNNLSNDDLVNSFVYGDDSKEYGCLGYENMDKNNNELQLKKENIEMCKELERIKIILMEKTLEINKLKSDKFILYNELNELVNSMKKVDLNKLNNFYKNNLNNNNFTKLEMPSSKGIKYNILSSQSHLIKIIKGDIIKRKLENNEENNDKIEIDYYSNILKNMEDDFEKLLDRKLSKKPLKSI
jgi:hypothetical protein